MVSFSKLALASLALTSALCTLPAASGQNLRSAAGNGNRALTTAGGDFLTYLNSSLNSYEFTGYIAGSYSEAAVLCVALEKLCHGLFQYGEHSGWAVVIQLQANTQLTPIADTYGRSVATKVHLENESCPPTPSGCKYQRWN